MKEQLMELIEAHNSVVSAAVAGNLPIYSRLSILGVRITSITREHRINAKCNMQTGEIVVYEDHDLREQLNIPT